ncbi:Rhotekin-2 [Gryllus bimaculatus]|nr:Rhotekin-2 [Gryllus bimaculatus]
MALPEEDPAGRLVEKRSGRLLEMALAIKIQEAVLRAALEREEEMKKLCACVPSAPSGRSAGVVILDGIRRAAAVCYARHRRLFGGRGSGGGGGGGGVCSGDGISAWERCPRHSGELCWRPWRPTAAAPDGLRASGARGLLISSLSDLPRNYGPGRGGGEEDEEEKKRKEMRTQPCLARVSLSDLRMPLIWRDTDHFKNKGDYRRFAVFCLARIGTEIYDTTLLCPVDSNNIPSDFEFKLEVYSHILQDDLSIASTPRKIKKTIHSSISRTVVDHILN